MRLFGNDADKSHRIGTLETAIARLAQEVVGLKEVVKETHDGVEDIQRVLHNNHLAFTQCREQQEGRWEIRNREHLALKQEIRELAKLVRKNSENIAILSANISRLADRMRGE